MVPTFGWEPNAWVILSPEISKEQIKIEEYFVLSRIRIPSPSDFLEVKDQILLKNWSLTPRDKQRLWRLRTESEVEY
jgi:hypothetical protein